MVTTKMSKKAVSPVPVRKTSLSQIHPQRKLTTATKTTKLHPNTWLKILKTHNSSTSTRDHFTPAENKLRAILKKFNILDKPNALNYKKSKFWKDTIWKKNIPKIRHSYSMYGKPVEVPRKLQLYSNEFDSTKVQGEKSYTKKIRESDAFGKFLAALLNYGNECLKKDLFEVDGNTQNLKPFNAVLVNWYEKPSDYIGFHSDLEKGICQETPVFSLSLGCKRKFAFLDKDKKTRIKELDIGLEHGTAVMMGGSEFQKRYKHSCLKMSSYSERAAALDAFFGDDLWNDDDALLYEPFFRLNITLRRYEN